jgi:hypothetical protein
MNQIDGDFGCSWQRDKREFLGSRSGEAVEMNLTSNSRYFVALV